MLRFLFIDWCVGVDSLVELYCTIALHIVANVRCLTDTLDIKVLTKNYMFIKNIKFVIQEIIFVYKMFVVYMIYMSLYIQIESLSIFYTCYCFFLNIKRFVKILILCTIIDDL